LSSNVREMRDEVRQLKQELNETRVTMVEMERLMFRYFALARRFGLPENMMEAIVSLQQMITTVRMLRTSITLLYTATGPIGWLTALGGATMGLMMLGDQMEMRRPRY